MRRTPACFSLFLVGSFFFAGAQNAKVVARGPVPPAPGDSLRFEPNRGQDASDALYLARVAGGQLRLFDDRGELALVTSPDKRLVLQMEHARHSPPVAEQILPATASYFEGNSAGRWQIGVPGFGRVRYPDLLPGVDLVFHGQGTEHGSHGSLEYDLDLAPGADARSIRMRITGATQSRLNANGDVEFLLGGQIVTMNRPRAYQQGSSGRQAVMSSFRLQQHDGATRVGFVLGRYDHSRALVIDPTFGWAGPLTASYTPAGGSAVEVTNVAGLAVDSASHAFVLMTVRNGAGFVVARYHNGDVAGGVLTGEGLDTSIAVSYSGSASGGLPVVPTAIAVSSAGDIFVAGNAYEGLPVTSNAYQSSNPNGSSAYYNAFLAVFKPSGSSYTLSYLSYLGGSAGGGTSYGSDTATGVAVDALGNAYVTGVAHSEDFPTSRGSYQSSYTSGSDAAIFVAKFNPSASGAPSLAWSTLLGSCGNSTTYTYAAVAVDSSDHPYVAANIYGPTNGSGIPVTSGALNYTGLDLANQPPQNIFAVKLNTTGSALTYAAYLGPGITSTTGHVAVAVDGSGDAYVAGNAGFEDFPTTAGAYQVTYPGAFVAELNPAGSSLIYSTFLAGPSGAVDANNGLYADVSTLSLTPGCTAGSCDALVVGVTDTHDLPLVNALEADPDPPQYFYSHAFAVELNGTGSAALFSTYFGGSASSEQSDTNPQGAFDGTYAWFAGTLSQGFGQADEDFPFSFSYSETPAAAGFGYLAAVAAGTQGTPVVTISPSNITFSALNIVGVPSNLEPSASATALVRNMGQTGVSLEPATFSGPDMNLYTTTNDCSGTIAASSSCTYTVIYTPDQVMSAETTSTTYLDIPYTYAGGPSVTASALVYAGTAINESLLTETSPIGSPTISFGDVTAGTASGAQAVVVENIGDVGTNLSAPYFMAAYGDVSAFRYITDCPTTPAVLAPQASCTTNVVFSPPTPGFYSATLSVSSVMQTFTGQGVEGSGSLSGGLQLSETSINFGSAVVGSPSATQSVMVTNVGASPVSIYALTLPPAIPDFTVSSNSCPAYSEGLARQQSCTIVFEFTPSVTGLRSTVATLKTSLAGPSPSIDLAGTGRAGETGIIFPYDGLSFGDQTVNTSGLAQDLVIYNDGTSKVTLDRGVVTGDNGDFKVSGAACTGYTLTPASAPGAMDGGSCTVSVTFAPTATGSRSATITFYDAVAGSPMQAVTLTGTGVTAPAADVAAPGTNSLVFPRQAVNTTTSSIMWPFGNRMVSLHNTGSAAISVGQVVASTTTSGGGSEFSLLAPYDSCSHAANISSGSSCYVYVAFSPTLGGAQTGKLTFPVTYAGTTTPTDITVALSGTGVAAQDASGANPTNVYLVAPAAGVSSSEAPVSFSDTGNTAITSLTASLPAGSPFSIAGNGCTSVSLTPSEHSCSLELQFRGTASATCTLTFSVTYADGTTGSSTVTLNGILAPLGSGGLVFSTSAVAFGRELESTSSYQATIQLVNPTANVITLNAQPSLSGPGASAYQVSNGCGLALQATSNCSITLTFAPATAGAFAATLSETDNGPGGTGGNPHTASVTLRGTGVAAILPLPVAPSSTVNFANQLIGTVSAPILVSLSNPASGTSSSTGVRIYGFVTSDAMLASTDFPESANPGSCTNGLDDQSLAASGSVTLSPGDTCTFSVTFAPSVPGPHTGTLSIYESTSTRTVSQTITFTGTATGGQQSLTVTSAGDANHAVGVAFASGNTVTFSASGGSGTGYRYVVPPGTLPTGVALSASGGNLSGTVWVLGKYNFTVEAIDSQGNYGFLPFTLNATAVSVNGIAFDPSNRLYVADPGLSEVDVYSETVNSSHVVTGLTQTATITAGMNAPTRLAFDAAGNLYVTNIGNNTVTVYNSSLTQITTATISTGLSRPLGIAVDQSGNVYVANNEKNSIAIFTGSPSSGFTLQSTLTKDGSGNAFLAPGVLQFASVNGANVLVVGLGPEITPDSLQAYSTPLTALSSPIGSLSNYKCVSGPSGPTAIAFANLSNPTSAMVYVGNLYSGNVTGYGVTSFLGGSGARCVTPAITTTSNSAVKYPEGVAVDAYGNVFVANFGNSTVTVYSVLSAAPVYTLHVE